MEITEFEITQYKNNIQDGFGFSVAFSDILKIQHERPILFQEQIRQEGYPEFQTDISQDDRSTVFEFFSNEHDYRIAFKKDLLLLIYQGKSIHYENIRTRIEHMVNTFINFYSPVYFKRANLTHRYLVNESFLDRHNIDLKNCVPTYIFPELSATFSENLYSLFKNSMFNYNGILADVEYSLETNNEKLYGVKVICSYEQNIGDTNVILSRFDDLKQAAWNILHSSTTDNLREAMVEVK